MARIHVMLAGKQISEHAMETTPCVVGRDAGADVRIDNPGVSRKHCQFICENGTYFVGDLGSSNGTYVDGKRVNRVPVQNGTEVHAGKYVLLFEDKGLEFLPTPKGAPSRPAGATGGPVKPGAGGGFEGAQMTFQVDAATLRQQMSKAGEAMATSDVAKKATEVAQEFDLNAQLATRKDPERVGRGAVTAIKILGIAIAFALVVLGICAALMR